MTSSKHIKNGCVVLRKLNQTQISSKNLSSLINISFAYARAAIYIQWWLKC